MNNYDHYHGDSEDERSTFSRRKSQDYQSCSDYLDFLSQSDLQNRNKGQRASNSIVSSRSSVETLHDETLSAVKDDDDDKNSKNGFSLRKFFQQYDSSLLLENKSSVARDHLANERTYLAWLRTSLSLISVGIGVTQLFHLQHTISKLTGDEGDDEHPLRPYGKPLGLAFILIGIIYLVAALVRYLHIQSSMTQGYFPASRSTIVFTTLCTFTALVFIFIIISLKKDQ